MPQPRTQNMTIQSPARRRLLLGIGGALALSALDLRLPLHAAEGAMPPEVERFMALSRYLTGRDQLSPLLAERYLAALSQQNEAFPNQLDSLLQILEHNPELPPERLQEMLAEQDEDLAELPARIVSAWYLGQVGEVGDEPPLEGRSEREVGMPGVEVIAFEHALMFDPVRDVLTVQSYCRAAPGFWAQPPA